MRAGEEQARTFKAIDLEDAIVAAGFREPVLTEEMKAAGLAGLSKARGKRMTASKDTWDMVAVFLADRFGART